MDKFPQLQDTTLVSQRRIAYEIGSTPDRGRIGQRYKLLE